MTADPVKQPEYSAPDASMKPFVVVWIVVVVINLLEVVVARSGLGSKGILTLLGAMALLSASLVVAFFMHMRYEGKRLVLSLIPALLFVLVMMSEMTPDSVRLHNMRSPIKLDTPAATEPQQ